MSSTLQAHADPRRVPVHRLSFARADNSTGSLEVTKNHLIMRLMSATPINSTATDISACKLSIMLLLISLLLLRGLGTVIVTSTVMVRVNPEAPLGTKQGGVQPSASHG